MEQTTMIPFSIPSIIGDIQKLQDKMGITQLNKFITVGETVAATQRMIEGQVGEMIRSQRNLEKEFNKSFRIGAAAKLATAGALGNTLAYAETTAKLIRAENKIAAAMSPPAWCDTVGKAAQLSAEIHSSIENILRHESVFKAVSQLNQVGAFAASERLAKTAEIGTAWQLSQETFNEITQSSKRINETFFAIANEVSNTITPPPSADEVHTAASFLENTMDGITLENEAQLDLKGSIDAAAEKIAQAINATQKSKLNGNIKQLLFVILGVILSQLVSMLFPPCCAQQVTTNEEHNNQLKAVKSHVRSCGIEHNKMRIVTVRTALNVRQRPNKKSRVIGKLPPFAIVAYQDKANRWVLIRYEDPNSKCAVVGWVFNKYLSTIGR
ncbi:SH3 domain-containing protein [Pseudodesulfovibrio senegalensis]|nr:SH3 domain-containing protein [Pseudodesulfovibrio senegalensis]